MNKLLAKSAVAVAVAALAACQQQQQQGAQAPAPASDTILIGEYGSLTGSEATFGQSTHKGIMLAVQEQNAAGGIMGKKIAVKTYDTAGRSQEAGTAVTRLITDDKVVAVLGEVASSLSIAGGRVAQQYGVPMITPSSTAVSVTQIGDMISRVCFIDPFQGYVAAKFARENLKLTKAAILYDQAQAYSKGLKDDFKKAFLEMGGTITAEQAYSGGDQDYSAQLTTMKSDAPEIIYVPGYYTDVGNIALQARKLGIVAPLLGGDGWDSEELAKIAGPAIDGSFFSNHYSPQDERAEVKNFVERFKAANNGEVPDGLGALAYDAARVLFDAMKRANSLDGKAIAKAINETKNFPGVTGNITMDANRNAEKSAVMVQMKNGERTYYATIEPKRP